MDTPNDSVITRSLALPARTAPVPVATGSASAPRPIEVATPELPDDHPQVLAARAPAPPPEAYERESRTPQQKFDDAERARLANRK